VWAVKQGIPDTVIDKNRDILRMAAMLHDVGKVAISDSILKKPGRLNNAEREVMKLHTIMGARLFSDRYSEFDEMAAVVALTHHEQWDGTGYPGHVNINDGKVLPGNEIADGTAMPKKGQEISVFGRLVALADVYDALGSRRAYKERWDEARVFEELNACSGTYFDPEIVEMFFSCIETIRSIRERYPDS
jgi:response regulator RpfG family c-di-GMP phosphodiesterase